MSLTTVRTLLAFSLSLFALSPGATALVPLRPQNVKLVPVERGLLVSWDPPGELDDRPVERYSVGYGKSMKSLRYTRVDGSKRSQLLEDVEPGVLHFLKMTADNKDGQSKPVYRAETPTGRRSARLDGFAVTSSVPSSGSVTERKAPSRPVRVEAARSPDSVLEQRRPPQNSGAEQPGRGRGFLLGMAQNDRRTVSSPVQAEQRSPRRQNHASESVYVVSLQAQKALGQSSPVHKAFMSKNPPADLEEMSEVKDITVRVMSPQSVFVSWVDPEIEKETAESSTRYYTLRYREKGESARWDYRETTQRRLLVENLSADNMYEFSIRISQGDHTSKWSVSVFQRTPESAPTGPPENFDVKPLRGKGTAVTATWDPPEETNGRIREYILSYAPALKPFGAKSASYRGGTTSAVVEGLQPGERYIFKIRAVNRRGQGPQSKAFSVVMPTTSAAASSPHSRRPGLPRPSRPHLRKDPRDPDLETRPLSQTRSYHGVFSSARSSARRTGGGQRTPQAPERESHKEQETVAEEKPEEEEEEEEEKEEEKEKEEEEKEEEPTPAARKVDTAVSYPERKDSYDRGAPKPAPREPPPEPGSPAGGNGGGSVPAGRYPGPGGGSRGPPDPRKSGQGPERPAQARVLLQRRPVHPLSSGAAVQTRPVPNEEEEEEEEERNERPTPAPALPPPLAPPRPRPVPAVLNRNLRPGFGSRVVPRQGVRVPSSRDSSLASVGAQTPVLKQQAEPRPEVSVSQDTHERPGPRRRPPTTPAPSPTPRPSPSRRAPPPRAKGAATPTAPARRRTGGTTRSPWRPRPRPAAPPPAELSENDSIERESVPERPRAPSAPRRPVVGPNGRLRYPHLANRQTGSRAPASPQPSNPNPRSRYPGRTAGKMPNGRNGRPNLTATNGKPVSTSDGNAKPSSGHRYITSPEGLKWIVDLDKGVLMNENGRILQDSHGKPRRVILGEDGRTIFDAQGSPLVNSEGLALFGHGRDSRPVVNPKDKFFTLGGKQIVGLDRPTPKTTTTTTATTTTTTPEPTTTMPTTPEVTTEEPTTMPLFPTCPPGTYSRVDDLGYPMFDDDGILNCYPDEGSSGMGMDAMVTVSMATDRADALAIEEDDVVARHDGGDRPATTTTTEATTTQPITRANIGPSSPYDAAGKKRFTAPYVNYIRKDPGAPCSLTEALEFLQVDVLENLIEQDSIINGRPPKHKPANFTVVAMEGCHSFVILDWARPLKDDMVSGYMVHSASYDDILSNRWSSRTSTGTHLSVENLKPNSRYYFKVQAKNVFGLGPLSETITYVTESDDPLLIERPPGGEPIWVPFSFKYNPGHSVCKGSQFVKRTWYKKFVGVVLCNSLRYKIFMGDGLKDTFYSIGDTFGYGEDHCQFVDSYMQGRTGPQSLSAYLPTAQGYYRAYRQEPVKFGAIGRNTPHNFVGWYECGIPIPGKW
ncbi:hypothetical protein ANANG_G00114780 [Anguilla anguilla]|uniref:Fibronectin type-III domain-containing protein n=1 Tax=Anguilla anguilla TaxID=7936 RepID=A0A9D3RX58_ANGAN|nr:hypothetical protein ANANG_G00114780 [Anguilla anguilla]